MNHTISRRNFVKTGATIAAAAAFASPRARGANERLRLGIIGTGNRGGQLIERAKPHEDAEIVAVCDVYEPHLEKWKAALGGGVAAYADYRKMLEDTSLDGILVASPDHWHALHTIDACNAGFDVYCEKPMSYTIVEGRKMVDAARRNNAVVQVGLQRRSMELYLQLREMMKEEALGKITVGRSYRLSNMFPDGMGREEPGEVPPGLDWEMWLGPRPERLYQDNIAPYKFRWWKEYSSQMTNWGVHYFDLIRWQLGQEAITSTSVHGGVYAVNDDRTIPDTMEAIFEFPMGCLMVFGQYEANQAPAILNNAEVELRGTQGTFYGRGNKGVIEPEKGGQFQDPAPRMERLEMNTDQPDPTIAHIRDWLDCIKSREKPRADVEIGHRSTTIAHLGNISMWTKSRIEWDPDNERITNNEAANDYLHYEYRAPWKLE